MIDLLKDRLREFKMTKDLNNYKKKYVKFIKISKDFINYKNFRTTLIF